MEFCVGEEFVYCNCVECVVVFGFEYCFYVGIVVFFSNLVFCYQFFCVGFQECIIVFGEVDVCQFLLDFFDEYIIKLVGQYSFIKIEVEYGGDMVVQLELQCFIGWFWKIC